MEGTAEMTSEMQHFYNRKSLFVTGGSGFLGKVIIEKLLRTTNVKRIYVLIRSKRGQNMLERLATWKDDAVFGLVLKSKPNCFERIMPIAGDCQEPDLGISQADRQLLVEEVQVVLHGAATVRFVEPLHLALDINTRATRLMLHLAKQMHHLEAFVHVSTAFSNCVIQRIDECFYPDYLTCSADTALALRERLSDELIDNMTSALLGKFPNTYTYTKALAEQLVQEDAGDLPICIFRPGVIIGSYKEPVSGWIDNLYGPIAILYGTAFGVLRIVRVNVHAQANMVPVDFCANLLLASAWQTAKKAATGKKVGAIASGPPLPPTIYNYVPSDLNALSWGGFKEKAENLGNVFPLTKMIWLPFLHTTNILFLFKLVAFFYHIVPGFFIDVALRLQGRRPRMIKLYKKIHKNVEVLSPFVDSNWYFETRNTQQLWQCLSAQDQQMFNFDMSSLDWDDYFYRALGGMRIYLAKEDPGDESLAQGKRKLARFYFLHRLLQFLLWSGAAAILWSLLKVVVRL